MAFAHSLPGPASCQSLRALKVCAVTSPADAELIASIGLELLPVHTDLLIGMILWPKSRRSISISCAREIVSIAHSFGATPVAVFVDEDFNQIISTCEECNVKTAQLHGPKSRASWASMAPTFAPSLSWIDVRDVGMDSSTSEATPLQMGMSPPSWTLFDAKGGGTGNPFDWSSFQPPMSPWLLAGGLNPDNVVDAVRALHPSGLDVASGVAGPDKCTKDPDRLQCFIERTIEAYSQTTTSP